MEKRIEFTLPEKVWKILEKIAEDNEITVSSVIRHAIGLEKYFSEITENGGKFYVQRKKDKNLSEMIYPYR
jgi:hypothetical protein